MNYNIKIIIYLILVIIETILDKQFRNCKNNYGKLLLIFHHFISIYLYFGSFIFGYHLIHLLFIILVGLLYKIYKKCPITIIQNNLCNFENNTLFQSYLNHIHMYLKNMNIMHIHLIMLIIISIYDLYYINKNYKFIKI